LEDGLGYVSEWRKHDVSNEKENVLRFLKFQNE